MKASIIVLLALLSFAANAGVYKCTRDGKTAFTATPAECCEEQALKVIQADPAEAERLRALQARLDADSKARNEQWAREQEALAQARQARREAQAQAERDQVERDQLAQLKTANWYRSLPYARLVDPPHVPLR